MGQLIDQQNEIPVQHGLPRQRDGDDFARHCRLSGKTDRMAGGGNARSRQFAMQLDCQHEGVSGIQTVFGGLMGF